MDPFVSEISVMWPLMYTNILISPSLALLNGLFLNFFYDGPFESYIQ